jgi:hypothetical protein
VLASHVTLVALSYILQSRLGRRIPALDPPPSRAGSGPEPASPHLAERIGSRVAPSCAPLAAGKLLVAPRHPRRRASAGDSISANT